MNRLLKFEFRKLFRQKSFYICGAIMVGMILLSVFSLNIILDTLSSPEGEMLAGSGMDAYMGYHGLQMLADALNNSSISIILAVFLSLYVCNDYTSDTLKNIIAKGYGRVSIYASKFIVSLTAATIYTVVCWLTGFLSGTAFWGVGTLDGTVGDLILVLIVQLLVVYAYTALFFFIGVALRRGGGAIAVGIVGPVVLNLILSFIDVIWTDKSFQVSNYWIDSLLVTVSHTVITSDMLTRGIVTSLIYVAILGVCAHLIGRRHQV